MTRNGRLWEPRSPALLREVISALRAPEPELPRRRRGDDPDRVAEALAAESSRNPAWTHAVVFTTCRPVLMGDINGGQDYYLFPARWAANRALLTDWSPSFREPELWELGGGGWHRAA